MNAVNPALMQRLFLMTASAAGAEQDSSYIVEADNEEAAREALVKQVRHDAENGDEFYERDDDDQIMVYIVDVQPLSEALLRRVQHDHTRQTPEPGM